MDSLLKEMGVENNTEDDILAKALKRKISSTSSDRNPRLYGRTIALSIVENAVPEVEANPELDSIFQRRSKQLTKKETNKINQVYESARFQSKNLQIGKLNSLVGKVGAKGRHADDASIILERIGDFDSISHFDPTADLDDPFDISASYEKKERENSPDEDRDFFTCPICEQIVKTTSNEIFNKHIDRCSRRSRGRNIESSQTSVKPNTSKKSDHGEFADFEDDEDEFDTINTKRRFSRLRRSSRQVEENRRSSLASSNSSENIATLSQNRHESSANRSRDDDEYPQTDDNDDEEEGEEAIVSSALPVDDWEDEDYFERLGAVDRTALQLCETPFGTRVFESSWSALHDYQKEGCRWLYEKYRDGVGGILADEMGLGKTAQISAHFGSLAAMTELVGSRLNAVFLIVCPATVLHHWLKEMHRWSPSMRTVILHGISSTGSELCRKLGDDGIRAVIRNLCSQRRTKGLAVISTYEGLRRYRASLLTIAWTAVCLDEGQKIRNANADITLICKKLSSFHRVILSGTPIQNNLKELWSLFDFIYPGRLGTLTVFDLEFATPIRVGGYLNATKLQYEIAIRSAFTLQRIVQPYLLRRKKDDLILAINLPAKTEQVLFCRISPKQREIYSSILSSDEVRAVIEKRIAAFRAINTLRKLCNHPFLVYRRGSIMWQDEVNSKLGKAKGRRGSRTIEEDDYLSEAGDHDGNDDMSLTALLETEGSGNIRWQDSGKMLVLSKILPLWYKEGHKVLLFSQTRAMLDLMEIMVKEMKFKFLRLDGSTPVSKRSFIIDQFNAKKDIFIMLLTTRTGGVGISLTAANRVVLFDPDWNPMTDIQSRERAWRLGQTREVVIYRLITRGTIEEKIYQRQIFKLLLTNRVLENPKQKALFSKTEIKELFELTDTNKSDPYHMHGSNVTEEDLPLEGQVNLTDPEEARPTAPFYSADVNDNELLVDDDLLCNDDAQVDKSADQLPDAEQDAEDLELFSSRELMSDRNLGFEVEDYVDQPLAMNENQDKASVIDNLSIIDMEESNETTKTDRKLLKALFDGEAITSVYNHNYLEPGQKEQKKDSFVTTRFIQEKAARAVEGAYNHLKSSAPMFHSSASYSNDPINSSTHLLAIMRSNQNRSRVESSSSSGHNSNSGGSSHPVASVRHSSSQSSSSTSMAAPSEARRLSVDEQIRHRLLDLFAKNPRQPLSTVYILQQFKDLGDQYAPLFKEILRSIATRSNGRWLKK